VGAGTVLGTVSVDLLSLIDTGTVWHSDTGTVHLKAGDVVVQQATNHRGLTTARSPAVSPSY
jgi:hypothetical protein